MPLHFNHLFFQVRGAVFGSALAAGFAAFAADSNRRELLAEANTNVDVDKIIETTGARIEGLKEQIHFRLYYKIIDGTRQYDFSNSLAATHLA